MSTSRRRVRKSTTATASTSNSESKRRVDIHVKAVKSAMTFYRQSMKRSDIRGIMEDLSKL